MILEDKVLDVIEGKATIRTGESLPSTSETSAAAASSQKEATETAAAEGTEKGR
jgi:hypothetical protein